MKINLAICDKALSISDLNTGLETIVFLSSRCIILGIKNAKYMYQSVSVLTDQVCVGFKLKVPLIHFAVQ